MESIFAKHPIRVQEVNFKCLYLKILKIEMVTSSAEVFKLIQAIMFSFLGANIFLSSDGHVKLGDFGCAVRLQKHNTMPGEISAFMGTAGKMFNMCKPRLFALCE